MEILINILIFIGVFAGMEGMAWATHKYVMHGFLWYLHADHHKRDHDSVFERNDAFFIFYAAVSIGNFMLWSYQIFDYGLAVGLGILAYGLTYFLVHDVFIHQRLKWFRNANSRYAKALRRAHKMHHKHLGKDHGECFGMLLFPLKYLKNQ